ncbi:TPA: restriction endonuclease subunit S [Yersinia enterocolitica]
MAKYKAYPEYKDSGVEWLGEMPCHWRLHKAKYIFRKVQRAATELDGIVTAFRDGQVTLRSNRRVDGFTNALKEIGYQGVKVGDLLVHAMDGFAGAIGISDSDGKCSPVCSVCIPWDANGTHMSYYGYLVRQLAVTDFILSLAKGIRERSTEFRFSEFSGLFLSIPPLNEQTQIARFLDHETAKIDKLIEKQQQLIELLKEKRQAVISHAVTKGLNPDVPMKDSGVEWLGEVPEHWVITKLKWIGKTTSGGTPSTSKFELYYEDGHIPWVRTTDLNNSELFDTPIRITSKAVNETACSILPVGSLLLGMYGGAGSIGKHSLLRFESTVNQAVCGVLPCEKILPDFLHKYYEFYRPFWMIEAAGTRKDPNIGQDNIKEGVILIPPFEEQILINTHINEMHKIYECVISNAFEGINLLQERRTALISAAVTGKIDVRDWVAPDTHEVEVLQEVTA